MGSGSQQNLKSEIKLNLLQWPEYFFIVFEAKKPFATFRTMLFFLANQETSYCLEMLAYIWLLTISSYVQ